MIRNIPLITKNLLIINLIAFLAMLGLRGWGIDLNDVLGLHFFLAGNFHVYQLFTYMFMHGGWEHILFNMFALWMFGSAVEYRWGTKRFLFFYIFCGVGAGLLQEMAQLGRFYMMAYDQIPQFSVSDTMALAYNSRDYLNLLTTVGASGAIYAVMLADRAGLSMDEIVRAKLAKSAARYPVDKVKGLGSESYERCRAEARKAGR